MSIAFGSGPGSIAYMALRYSGQITPGATPSTDLLADALFDCNAMLDSWNAEELTQYFIDDRYFQIATSQQSYTLGPTGDFNTDIYGDALTYRPQRILRANLILTNNSQQSSTTTNAFIDSAFIRTLLLYDLAAGTDIAPDVNVYRTGTAARVVGVLRVALGSDLTIKIWTVRVGVPIALITCTIPAATAVETPIEFSAFTSTSLVDGDVLRWDVLASDGATDTNGIATFTLQWDSSVAGDTAAPPGNVRVPIEIIPVEDFADIPVIAIQSQITIRMYVQTTKDNVTLWCFPYPTVGNQFEFFMWPGFPQFASLAATLDAPPGYQDAITWGLAERLYLLNTKDVGHARNVRAAWLRSKAVEAKRVIERSNAPTPTLTPDLITRGNDGQGAPFSYLYGDYSQ